MICQQSVKAYHQLMHYYFYNECPQWEFNENNLVAILETLQSHFPLERYDTISLAFLTKEHLCQLHEQFLNDPQATDVITFPASDKDDEALGELCISIDAAQQYAVENQTDFSQELCLYIVHGWLHLYGFDDIDDRDRLQMRQAEQEALQQLKNRQIKLYIQANTH